MLLQSMRVLCKAPGGAASSWKYLEALVRASGVSGRCAYGFRTDLHVADGVEGLLLHIAVELHGKSGPKSSR